MAERLRAPSPMEAAAKTIGNAEALRSSGGARNVVVSASSFRLFFSAPEQCSKLVTFLLQMCAQPSRTAPLLIVRPNPEFTDSEWEEPARRQLKSSKFHLQKKKKKDKKDF